MHQEHLLGRICTLIACLCTPCLLLALDIKTVDLRAYPNLQAAIDANPGRIIQLPPSEYEISSALRVTHSGTELIGPARIIQTNPQERILAINGASNVRLRNLSFTRSATTQDTEQHGIEVTGCSDVILSGLRVSENHTRSSIVAISSRDVTVENCTVTNYKGLTIDDRSKSPLYGFAFKAIDGTGIQMRDVDGIVIRDNRVQEFRLLPTRETRDRHSLGTLTVVPEKPGRLMDQDIFDSRYTNNWHQGAGIHVTVPYGSKRVVITGNYVENAAQGLDLHADHAIVANNIFTHAMIGMKAMHGSKHVLIDGNQFTHCDLWGLKLMPGAGSFAPDSVRAPGQMFGENVDGGHIVSNNIFSYFGHGEQHWNWKDRHSDYPERNVIAILFGQLEESPPLRNVLITGNVVHDSGQDSMLVDGKWVKVPPRYFHALYVEQKRQPYPRNVQVNGNLFDPGLIATSNVISSGN